jgi:hypothetical protein
MTRLGAMDVLQTPDSRFENLPGYPFGPNSAGQPHARINGSHFIQEDCGPELAERILSWKPTEAC